MDENAQIVAFERGPEVSFANCGLPSYLGGVIAKRNILLVVSPERSRRRLRLDVILGVGVRPESELARAAAWRSTRT
jgi:NADPH-dependent 2,4-dienoyl-CoA reductase/sulfur reductase-like enzyme